MDFEARDMADRIRLGKVACLLVIILMPAGFLLDLWLYPDEAPIFLGARLVCSLLVGGLLALHYTELGRQWIRPASWLIALLPALFISGMIAVNEGANSPYYAGLNLILLATNVVVHWNLRESLLTSALIVALYVMAITVNASPPGPGQPYAYLFFMIETAVIVITGNYFYNRLRLREFEAQHDLQLSQQNLEHSNKRLLELDELKGRFFANISHELRTPLTLVLAPLENLRQHPQVQRDSPLRDCIQTMHANSMRLLKLINDLLDLVRLDAGQMRLHRQAIDVKPFLEGTLNAVRQFAEDRRLRLALTINPGLEKITADPDRLEKVFLNLLFNAMKFTPAGGVIRVQASADGGDALFEIIDTGVGMSPESVKHLFSRFWQADTSSQRKYQGVGIGLALVKELVEAHAGSVTGESQLGQGTTFRVRLPLHVQPDADEPPADASATPAAPEPQPQAAAPEAHANWLGGLYRRAELFGNPTPLKDTLQHGSPPSRTGKPRVLIVDDEPDMVRFLRTLLDAHYEVIEAADGDQALTLAAQYLPDVIVCDFMLPHKDGLAVCHDLRSRELTRAIPVIILTARADEATKLNALEAGASDFLAKPFSLAELHVRVKNLADGYRAAKALARQKQTLEATLEELHDTEAQLIQAAKMASLGRMSAGIIHEINNPLNYALTALSVLSFEARHLPPDNRGEFLETLKDVQDGLQRVGKIIADLREFTHPRGGDVEIIEVNHAIEGALRFLRAEVAGKVDIDNRVPDGFAVRAVATKLMQVFVNLVQNSVDALREKTFPEGTKPQIRFEAAIERGAKTVKVWDNGPGIPASHISKVFDPFYTTKEVNQGTGMGLSICYRLLQEVGAQITVRSEPDVCCEFRITFPDPANDQIELSTTSTTIAA